MMTTMEMTKTMIIMIILTAQNDDNNDADKIKKKKKTHNINKNNVHYMSTADVIVPQRRK